MELLLIGVAVVSLGIAIVMSVVAWSLLRGERQRSAARVEALEALAFTDETHRHEAGSLPTSELRPAHAPAVEPPRQRELPGVSQSDDWDFALGGHQSARSAPQSEELFDHRPAPGVAGRRWLAIAAVVLVIGAAVAITTALRSPELVAAIAASRTASPTSPTSTPNAVLALLSLRHTTDPDGTFTVTGLVQNPADGHELDHLEAVVYLFDDNGRFFAKGQAGLEVPAVGPGDESPFIIKVATPYPVSRYRVGFRRSDGRVVAHVDRRGQLPTGTTGDAIDEPDVVKPAGGMRPISGAAAR